MSGGHRWKCGKGVSANTSVHTCRGNRKETKDIKGKVKLQGKGRTRMGGGHRWGYGKNVLTNSSVHMRRVVRTKDVKGQVL